MGADVFSAISAPVRREILGMLAVRDMPVLQIAESFEMSVSAVSQHLAILKDANLVAQSKQGRQRIYRLTPNPLTEVADWLEKYEQFWTRKLEKLDTFLENNS